MGSNELIDNIRKLLLGISAQVDAIAAEHEIWEAHSRGARLGRGRMPGCGNGTTALRWSALAVRWRDIFSMGLNIGSSRSRRGW